jgi:hypothetical protein
VGLSGQETMQYFRGDRDRGCVCESWEQGVFQIRLFFCLAPLLFISSLFSLWIQIFLKIPKVDPGKGFYFPCLDRTLKRK